MSVTRTIDHPPVSLPQVRTALLGRAREAATLHRLLVDDGVRLVTLVGPGGVGKTRLALHVAGEAADDFAGDVAFVPLAAIREPRLVLLAIGGAVGFVSEPDEAYEAGLAELLQERRMLLVLDNLEQVIEVAPVIGRLLDTAPGLTVLATSQVPLDVLEERTFPLAPLPTLDPADAPVTALVDLDAFELFVERARAVDPSFTAGDPDVARDIAQVCYRLDGLPLAIELAAARANVMSPRTLLERLENRVSALGEYRGDVPDRLRTMRAAIGWSYELLDPDQQALFRPLSVFAGGWSEDAATAVFPDGRAPAPDLLQALVRRSLVRVGEPVLGVPRYMMLQTLADFGQDMLARREEEADARLAHAMYIVRLAEDAEPHLTGSRQPEQLVRLDAEMDNIRAAMEWALRNDRIDLALRLVGALWRYLSIRALVTDGRAWLERALASRAPGLMPYRVKALVGAGYLAEERRDLDVAQAYFEQGLHLASAMGNIDMEGQALIGLGTVAHDRGEYDIALGHHEGAVELARQSGNRRALAIGYGNLGAVTYFQGRLEESLRHFSEGADILLALGDIHAAAIGISNMAAVANELGDHELGVMHIRRALELQRQLNLRRDLPSTLVNLGEATRELGQYAESRAAFVEALSTARENDDMTMYALALHGLAVLEYVQQQFAASASMLLESTELLAGMNDPHSMIENAHLAALLCLECGRYEDAASLIVANDRLSEELGIGVLDRRREKVAGMIGTAKAALGEERFAGAAAAGQAMDMETLTRRIASAARGIIGPRHAPVSLDLRPDEPPANRAETYGLTAREVEILRLLAAGKPTAEMAAELFVSSRTISTHVTHILEKLGQPNRTAAVAFAMRERLV